MQTVRSFSRSFLHFVLRPRNGAIRPAAEPREHLSLEPERPVSNDIQLLLTRFLMPVDAKLCSYAHLEVRCTSKMPTRGPRSVARFNTIRTGFTLIDTN
jgi:hypothetical protein